MAAKDEPMFSNEERIRHLIMNVFYNVIVDRVESTDVMIHLQLSAVKPRSNELRKLDKDGKHFDAITVLLELVDQSDEPGKWTSFILSLKEAEYDHLYSCLEYLEDIPNLEGDKQYNLIGIFRKSIITQVGLKGSGILPLLRRHGVITERQHDKLRNCIRHDCEQDAWLDLFSYIHKRSNNWYDILLEAFIEDGHVELVKSIDPDFMSGRDGKQFNYEIMDYEESVLTGSGDAYDMGDSSGNDVQQSDLNDFSLSDPKKSKLESLQADVLFNSMETAPKSYEKITEIKKLNITVSAEDVEMLPVPVQTTERDFNCKELILRPYQDKLCANALNGENVLICAPTGSGKTYVATKIIMEHIKSRERRGIFKVAFLVNQVALAEQQSRVLKEYLNQRIEIITGDTQSTDKVTLAKLLPITDIIVMTAQIFVDSIAEKEIENVTLFSLIIFDECHHTKARHPYNQLMNKYIDLKLKTNSVGAQNVDPIAEEYGHVPTLPQIVGLTASLGVGKASKVSGAKDHIISLCANLDVSKICTPDEEGADNMSKYVNTPVTRFERAPGRTNDLFHKTVAEIMNDIEKEMKESPFLQTDEESIKKFKSDHLKPPGKKGHENYTQWVNVLKRETARFDDPNARKFFVTCQKMLDIYNSALIINNDCRSKDSLQYIEDGLEKKITPNQSTDARRKLMRFYESRLNKLRELSRDNKNPKLEKLKDMIIQAFEVNPDSRAIVFAKTLSLVQKLKNCIQETPELSSLKLNPETVTGASASADQGGMTKNRQLEVLECFKEGSGKLIIATSVAEEGLDIQKCNLVIRYDHVTNEIAMVQSRGRARAENSQFMVVTADDSKSEKKEQINLSRELMMRQAISLINVYEQSEFTQKVLDHQKKAKIMRDSEKRVRNGRVIDDSEFELRCFQCNSLACFSSDIRTIKHSSYTVLADYFIESYATREHPEPSEFKAGFMKKYKIYCKQDDCRQDWGIIAMYLNSEFPLIKIEHFVIVDSDGKKTTAKKWKNVPFPILEMSDDDLRRRLADSSGNRPEDDSGDDLN